MSLQIILETGITLAIKIDQLRLCLILNNYIAAHIADYLHNFSSGSSPYRTDSFTSSSHSQPQIKKLIVLNDPRRLSAIFLNQSARYCFEKNHKIKIVFQSVNNHFDS